MTTAYLWCALAAAGQSNCKLSGWHAAAQAVPWCQNIVIAYNLALSWEGTVRLNLVSSR